MRELLADILVGALIAVTVGGVGYGMGSKHAEARWQAKENTRLQAERDAQDAEFRRGDKASGALQAELLQRQIDSDQLTKAFNELKRRNTLLARRPVGQAIASGGPAANGAAVQCAALPAGDGVALSLGAVWMWNSALTGRDTPAGSCGLADTSEGACAADAGVTLEDAWDNQAVNARICAENRVRHQRLIDFLEGRK